MKSSSVSLTKTLRSVEVLKSLTVGQLQRLQDLLTEVTFKEGDYIITQNELSENLYIIADGRVTITRKEAGSSEAKVVMELGQGAYFGERALLNAEPRAANVIAASTVKALYISKDAFEEVLGPLQEIIDADRQWREKIAHQKQLQQEQEGLVNVTISDFNLEGVTCNADPFQYVVAAGPRKKEYTIKAVSKAKVVALNLQQRVMAEKELAASLVQNHRMVPLALTTLQDDNFLYTVFKARIVMDLATLIGETGFEEKPAAFYSASVTLALEHLSDLKLVYRNLTPDSIIIDEKGYVQLMDMRFAVRVEPPPTDFCGYPHYLSPEQVSGQGHGEAVDFWALGILTYEMITGGGNPWLTGDPAKDSEVGIYSRISSHEAGSLKFPDGVSPSAPLVELLNDLLHPIAGSRLGERGVGAKEVRQAKWWNGFDWNKLESGKLDAPHKKQAEQALAAAMKANTSLSNEQFKGDGGIFSGFSSLFSTG